jgi:hypothetical protein
MQRLEVSGAIRHIYINMLLGGKELRTGRVKISRMVWSVYIPSINGSEEERGVGWVCS